MNDKDKWVKMREDEERKVKKRRLEDAIESHDAVLNERKFMNQGTLEEQGTAADGTFHGDDTNSGRGGVGFDTGG